MRNKQRGDSWWWAVVGVLAVLSFFGIATRIVDYNRWCREAGGVLVRGNCFAKDAIIVPRQAP